MRRRKRWNDGNKLKMKREGSGNLRRLLLFV